MNIPSKVVEQAVEEFASLPSIGKKSALRFVLHLLKQEPHELEDLARVILKLKNDIIYCTNCYNISDTPTCEICSNQKRDKSKICLVEEIKYVMEIKNTKKLKGNKHV